MEPVSLTAGEIAPLIFSKALEKGGEQFSKARVGRVANTYY